MLINNMENVEKETKNIEKLTVWDFGETVGYDDYKKPVADATNMKVLVKKINELVEEINKLKQTK